MSFLGMRFYSDEEIADMAYRYTGPASDHQSTEAHADAMIHYVTRVLYHIVSPSIKEACRKKVGL